MLILHSGSDRYRLHRATAEFVSSYRNTEASASNIFYIDGSSQDAMEQIERPLKYASFFDEKKLLVVHNAAGAAMASILKGYELSKLNDVVLVAVQHTQHDSCDKKVLAALEKTADRVELFEPLTGAPLSAWTRAHCATLGSTIEPSAVTAVLQRTGGDTQLLANELEKLCAYKPNAAISLQDVQTLVPARYEQDEWELSNALASHDKRNAIAVLWRRLQQGASEQLLLASLAAGVRNLSMVKDMQARHQPKSAAAAMTGLHPFVLSKTERGAAAADTTRLRNAHMSLARLDRQAKDGTADMVDGLFSVLISL